MKYILSLIVIITLVCITSTVYAQSDPLENPDRPYMTDGLENGDLVLSENAQYQIIFNDPNQKFTLILLDDNFAVTQRNAEDELQDILGLDELNMCRMYIEEEVPSSVNNEQSGKVYPFSRCVHEGEM